MTIIHLPSYYSLKDVSQLRSAPPQPRSKKHRLAQYSFVFSVPLQFAVVQSLVPMMCALI